MRDKTYFRYACAYVGHTIYFYLEIGARLKIQETHIKCCLPVLTNIHAKSEMEITGDNSTSILSGNTSGIITTCSENKWII